MLAMAPFFARKNTVTTAPICLLVELRFRVVAAGFILVTPTAR